ncbi:hypothetical protein, partial [uncultured Fibrobacter sp.]|uniref:hypothetical protein n=1 Tax=uncultured Fibrobacter sp. TaxID=261512 RepID=UPI00262EDE8B
MFEENIEPLKFSEKRHFLKNGVLRPICPVQDGFWVLRGQIWLFSRKNAKKMLEKILDFSKFAKQNSQSTASYALRNHRNVRQTRAIPRIRSDKPSAEEEEKMAKEHFDRSKPHCNIGTI